MAYLVQRKPAAHHPATFLLLIGLAPVRRNSGTHFPATRRTFYRNHIARYSRRAGTRLANRPTACEIGRALAPALPLGYRVSAGVAHRRRGSHRYALLRFFDRQTRRAGADLEGRDAASVHGSIESAADAGVDSLRPDPSAASGRISRVAARRVPVGTPSERRYAAVCHYLVSAPHVACGVLARVVGLHHPPRARHGSCERSRASAGYK